MTAVAETHPEFSVNLLDQVRVTAERDGGLIEAFVPIGLINQEDVAFDHEHVVELAESIQNESAKQKTTGQLSPILLAEVPGSDNFVIIDGFHRTPALASLGYEEVYATIKPGCTWEDVVDLRIVAAKSHKSVKFARIVEWVDEAWKRSPWSDKLGVSGAFQIAFLKGSNGSRSGVTPEESAEILGWVNSKCEQWGVPASKVHSYLRTARLADPALVKSARDRTSGHKLEAVTPKHLDQIARYLPENYPLQNIVADAAIENALTIPETRVLAIAISKAKDEDQVRACVANRVWRRMDSASASLTKKRYKEIDPDHPEQFVQTLMDKFFDEQITIAKLLIENAVLAGLYEPQLEEQNGRMNSLALESDTISENEAEIDELPEGQEVVWSPDNVILVAEKTIALNGLMLHTIQQKYHIKPHNGEDVVSVARIKLIQRIEAGKFAETLAEDDIHLRRLFMNFVKYAAIDHIRSERGRRGQKERPLSLDAAVSEENTRSLLDIVADETADNALVIDTGNADFIKRILPHLSERERRVLILKGYFELTAQDIAIVVGSTTASIAQCFMDIKRKTERITGTAPSPETL